MTRPIARQLYDYDYVTNVRPSIERNESRVWIAKIHNITFTFLVKTCAGEAAVALPAIPRPLKTSAFSASLITQLTIRKSQDHKAPLICNERLDRITECKHTKSGIKLIPINVRFFTHNLLHDKVHKSSFENQLIKIY